MYIVYKSTNLINERYYVGVHRTDDPNDSYMGSGPLIRKAIKKYGRENFKKEILYSYDDKEPAYDMEKEILEESLNDPLCYNLNPGGKGSWDYINENIWQYGKNNAMYNPETVRKVVETKKANGGYYTEAAQKARVENGKKGADQIRGIPRTEDVKLLVIQKFVNKCRKNTKNGDKTIYL